MYKKFIIFFFPDKNDYKYDFGPSYKNKINIGNLNK